MECCVCESTALQHKIFTYKSAKNAPLRVPGIMILALLKGDKKGHFYPRFYFFAMRGLNGANSNDETAEQTENHFPKRREKTWHLDLKRRARQQCTE